MSKLSDEVKRLEDSRESLHGLCEQILATLAVNRANGALMCKDPASEKMLDELIAAWKARFEKIGGRDGNA